MWESSGWIVPQDPYGWFQWYCRQELLQLTIHYCSITIITSIQYCSIHYYSEVWV